MKIYLKIDKKHYIFTSKSSFSKKWKITNEKICEKTLKPHIKMDKNIIKIDDAKTEKYKFLQHKSPFLKDNKNINKK